MTEVVDLRTGEVVARDVHTRSEERIMGVVRSIAVETTLAENRRREIFVESGQLQDKAIFTVSPEDLSPEERAFLYDHFKEEIDGGHAVDLDFFWLPGYGPSTGSEHFLIKTQEQMNGGREMLRHAMNMYRIAKEES